MRSRDYKSLWIALFSVNLVNSTQAAIAVVGIPSHALSEGLSEHELALLMGVFPIAACAAALFSGTISDLMGRRPALLAGLLLLGIGLLCHAFAKDFQTLMALRAVCGFATGSLTGLPSTLLSDNLPPSDQVKANGRTLSGYAIGQTIGIPIGIALLDQVSFPELCSGIGGIALLLALALRLSLPSHNPSRYLRSGELRAYFGNAMGTLRDGRFAMLAACSFLAFATLSLFYTCFALWLFAELGLRPSQIAPMHLAGGILQIVALTWAIQRLRRFSPLTTVSLSLFANSAIFLVSGIAATGERFPTLLLALTLGAVALRIPSVQFLANNLGSAKQKGLRMSLIQTGNHAGKATGYVLGSYLFGPFNLPQITLICGILTLACGTLLLLPRQLTPSSLGISTGKNCAPE